MAPILIPVLTDPHPLALPQSSLELPIVPSTVRPLILALPMRLAVLVEPSILISIHKHLNSVAVLHKLVETPFVKTIVP
jgi:hypothetical protein